MSVCMSHATSTLHVQYDSDVADHHSCSLVGDLTKLMTSKIDSPPPYEDAVHHPKHVNDPSQSQHGSPLPPPPSYSPSPGMFPGPPGYFGREGVYPQAGMWAAPGFSPSGMPTTIPTLSAGLHASNSGSEEMTQGFS